jgi:uncharacterized protein YneF (UPF0154 family)
MIPAALLVIGGIFGVAYMIERILQDNPPDNDDYYGGGM